MPSNVAQSYPYKRESEAERVAAIALLVAGTGSELAQTLGKTVLLFKQRKKKSKIQLVD